MQFLKSSLSVGDYPVQQCTGQSPTESDDIRGCIDTFRSPEGEKHTARNM